MNFFHVYARVNSRILTTVWVEQVPLDAATAQVDETGNYFTFQGGWQVSMPSSVESYEAGNEGGDDEEDSCTMQHPLIMVSKDPFSSVKGEFMVKTPDFMLVGKNMQLSKGYYVRIVHPELKSRFVFFQCSSFFAAT